MKRALALLLTMLMVISLFPSTAFAEEASTPEDGGIIASSDTPEATEEPTATPTAEITPTEALPSESPSLDALFLNLMDCSSTDSDGTGHVKQTASGEGWTLTVKCETNGDVSYRWQTLDQQSTAQDPYVDINSSENSTADEKTLVVPANEDALGVSDYYRCVVTASAGEETLVSYCCFTMEQGEEAPQAETQEPTAEPTLEPALPADGAPDMFTMGTSYYATSMEDIIYAIGAGKTDIICSGGSFSITANLTIPSNVSLTIYSNYVTVSIPSGVTLTNNGSITVDNMGYLDVSGTIKNAGEIECFNGGTMTVYDGASYQKTSTSATLVRYDYGQSGCSTITGVSLDQIDYVFEDTTGYGFYAGFEYAEADFRTKEVYLTMPTSIEGTDHATIPANTDVYMQDDMTISSDATLTNNGTLYVLKDATLTNHGTIENNGDILVYGTLDSDGTMTGLPYSYFADVNSDATLRAAITAGATDIVVKGSFSLATDLTIPSGTTLELGSYTITVPSGVDLTNKGSFNILTLGKLLIKSGAGLINSDTIFVSGGTLTVESGGMYQASGFASIPLDVGKSGVVTGISTSYINVYSFATTDSMMRTVLTYSNKGYRSVQIYVSGSISLASSMTIPSDVTLCVGSDDAGYRLTVPTGKTLTNDGYISVSLGNTLQLNAGATLVNNGQIEVFGEFIKNGTITGSGSITYGDAEVDSWASLLAAVEASRANITLTGDVVMEADLTIGSGTTLILDNTAAPQLTIPDGMTLTVNGALEQQGGGMTVQYGGTLLLNGYMYASAGTFTVDSGAIFENNNYFDLSGTAAGFFADGCYTEGDMASFQFTDVDGATLSGMDLSFVSYNCEASDSAMLTAALAKAADGYKYLDIQLYGEAELSDSEIASTVYLSVEDGSILTIATGEIVALSGTLDIRAGATLNILTDAKILIAEGGLLHISGTLNNDGTIEGGYSLTVSTEAALRDAIASGVTMLTVTDSFSLTSNLTIPGGVSVSLQEVVLTVPSGKTLQVDGSLELSDGTLNVSASGRLTNNGYISLFEKSRLTIATGAIYSQAAYASLTFTYGMGTISGIPNSKIDCQYDAVSEAQLRTGLALTGYRSLWVTFTGDVTLTSNLTVPANVTLMLIGWSGDAMLTVPSLKTLTVNGTVSLQEGSTLNIALGGTLNVSASGSIQILGGELIANGTVNYAEGAQIYRDVYTEAELIDAIEAHVTQVMICADIELTGDLTIPDTMEIMPTDGKTLTVPSGVTLTIGSTNVWLYDGALNVDGALSLADGGKIYIDASGSFTLGGDISFGGADAMILFTATADSVLDGVTGEDCDHVIAQTYVATSGELVSALGAFGAFTYKANIVMLSDSISIDEDMAVPAGVQLLVEGCTLTIPAGKTLTIDDGGELVVKNDGKLVVEGTLINEGKVTLSLDALSGDGTIEDNSEDFAYSASASTLAQLKSAIDSGKRPLTIEAGSFVISGNLTIPADVEVVFPLGSTASIASGITLTNNGKLTLLGKFTNSGVLVNNNYFTVEKSAVFTNNSSLYNNADADVYGTMVNNGTVTVKAGCRVRFHEDATKSGTRATGSWYSLVGQAATGVEIVGPSYVSLDAVGAQQYLAQMLPADAWPMDVHWSIKSGGDYAEIDEETGELTAKAVGDAVIRATAIDDEDVYGEMTVHVVTYAIDIQGESWMVAGKTLQLTGAFVPSNLTKTTILCSLQDGDSAYASINSTSGLVTAKAVTEETTITVIARAADGSVDDSLHEITIYPALSGMQILWNDGETDVNVSGKTLSLNSYAEDSLTFSCALIPVTAKPDITWTLSQTDAATMVENDDGSVTITPVEGKTKLIVVTAKATDGSGKTASVWIQVSAVSCGITISDPNGGELYAGKTTQLTVAFSDPQPTNTGVKWVMSPEYDAYATLSAKGLLTAKAVTQEVTIEVTAEPLDGGPVSDAYEVTIQPMTSALLLMRGDDYVTNTTQTVDLGHESTLSLTAVVWPDTASHKITFASSAPSIATVDDTGTVTILKAGLVTITAKATDGSGKLANVKLNIVSLPQEIAAVTPTLELRGGAGATYRVKDTTTGAILAASQVRWTLVSENPAVAKITTSGVLTTYTVTKPETITLEAKVIGNEDVATTLFDVTVFPATLSIQLYDDSAPFTGPVVFDTYAMPDGGGASVTLTVKTIPGDATPYVTWTSSNPTIATVEDGVIKPVWNSTKEAYNTGVATITAKTKDGTNLSAATAVQVVSLAQSISLETVSGLDEVVSGNSIQLKVTLENAKATNPKVYYSILTGSQFATVSTSGLVTAKTVYRAETIVVLASAADGSCEAELGLTVQPKEEDPLVIQPQDGSKTLNGTRESYNIKSAAAAVKLAANGYATGTPVTVKWSVSPSTIGRVAIVSGVPTLQSITTGVVTVTATDSKGRTASFTAEFYKPATSLTIKAPKGMDIDALTLGSGKTLQLSGVIAPTSGVTTSGVNWFIATESDGATLYLKDTKLASISSTGLLTAKAGLTEPQAVVIYAVSKNAPYLTDSVTVILTPAVTGLDLKLGSDVVNNLTVPWDISVKTIEFSAVVYPGTANDAVTWTSSDKSIATIATDGTVTALKAGTVTITAKAEGVSASFKLALSVRVTAIDITSKTNFTVRAGGTLQLGTTFTPTTPSDKRVTWKLLDGAEQYATISSTGLITAKVITHQQIINVQVTSVENKDIFDVQEITIYPPTTKVQILDTERNDVTGKTLILDLNEMTSMTLLSRNLPSLDSGARQDVVWKSSNTAVLRVAADGTLTPVKNATTGLYYTGTVTVTATAADGSGKYASVKVFVGYLVQSLTFGEGLTVKAGKTLTLKPTFGPANATNKALKWTIKASDTPYATISSTGVLTAKALTGEREITIYCEALDGSGTIAEITVIITV